MAGARNLIAVCFLALALGSPRLVAAQSISGANGDFVHDSLVTISGSSFGTRAIGSNYIRDELESGSFSSKWASTGALSVRNESRHPQSQKAGWLNFKDYAENGFVTGGSNDPGPWYCQYWFKLGDNWTWGTAASDQMGANLSNIKIFRMWQTGSSIENFYMATWGWSNTVLIKSDVVGQDNDYAEGGYQTSWSKGTWHLFQFEFKDSSLGAADGVLRWWVDGRLAFESTSIVTRGTDPAYKRPLIVGFFNSWGDASTDDNDFWIDEMQIDNSWGRVELGNASTYAACSHREIQPLSSWSSSQIAVNFRPGSFQAGDAAYLFVVDPAGRPSVGYPVTIGGTAAVGPGQPGQPFPQ